MIEPRSYQVILLKKTSLRHNPRFLKEAEPLAAVDHQVKVLSPVIKQGHWGRDARLARGTAEVVGREYYPMKNRQKVLHLWSEAAGRN